MAIAVVIEKSENASHLCYGPQYSIVKVYYLQKANNIDDIRISIRRMRDDGILLTQKIQKQKKQLFLKIKSS